MLSLIVGTIAVAYGSVPMYKMVRPIRWFYLQRVLTLVDLSTDWMGWAADQIKRSRLGRQYSITAGHRCTPDPHYLQLLSLRCLAVEVHAAAKRSQRPAR